MATLNISAKGQITLDDDLLKHLGMRPGQQITIEKLSGGQIVMKAFRPTEKISDVFGLLKRWRERDDAGGRRYRAWLKP
jgi:bifunctional DNA-binding transcriptional regulator/antitoxin component of YhaV-PrlF toxin-antitoxin module